MILNSYAILLIAVEMLTLVAGVSVSLLALRTWQPLRPNTSRECRERLESRSHLVWLTTLLLLVLNLVGAPLLFLLLQSYVAEWPSVMCIYGVTQVGVDSQTMSRYLPSLLALTQVLKPTLIALTIGWFVLHLINRRTQTSPLLSRLFAWACILGAVSTLDAATGLAYVAIPKKHELPPSGCCVSGVAPGGESRFWRLGPLSEAQQREVSLAFYCLNGALVLAYGVAARQPYPRVPSVAKVGLGALIVAAGVTSAVYVVEVAAPRILHLPYHHCPYDLITRAPDAVLACILLAASALAGALSLLMAAIATTPETESVLPRLTCRLLQVAWWAHIMGFSMLTFEVALA